MGPTKYPLIITADTNDADYVRTVQHIKEEQIPFFKKIASAIKAHGKYHNWVDGEYPFAPPPEEIYAGILTEEEIENFKDYVPYGEFGVHTIDSIKIYKLTSEYSEEELLD